MCTVHDIELSIEHRPGVTMTRADALSRAHTKLVFRDIIKSDVKLSRARRVRIPDELFSIYDLM